MISQCADFPLDIWNCGCVCEQRLMQVYHCVSNEWYRSLYLCPSANFPEWTTHFWWPQDIFRLKAVCNDSFVGRRKGSGVQAFICAKMQWFVCVNILACNEATVRMCNDSFVCFGQGLVLKGFLHAFDPLGRFQQSALLSKFKFWLPKIVEVLAKFKFLLPSNWSKAGRSFQWTERLLQHIFPLIFKGCIQSWKMLSRSHTSFGRLGIQSKFQSELKESRRGWNFLSDDDLFSEVSPNWSFGIPLRRMVGVPAHC